MEKNKLKQEILEEFKRRDLWLISIKDEGEYYFIGTRGEADERKEEDEAEWKKKTIEMKRLTEYGIRNIIINDNISRTTFDNWVNVFIRDRVKREVEKECRFLDVCLDYRTKEQFEMFIKAKKEDIKSIKLAIQDAKKKKKALTKKN